MHAHALTHTQPPPPPHNFHAFITSLNGQRPRAKEGGREEGSQGEGGRSLTSEKSVRPTARPRQRLQRGGVRQRLARHPAAAGHRERNKKELWEEKRERELNNFITR